MDYGLSERPAGATPLPTAIKILVAGGFGVGKTTMVGAVSETRPLRTEEVLTESGVGIDDLSGVESKKTTTVAMDFGRITISDDLVLYLFGTPGQDRFWFVWDELALGALGAVVLADTRRLADCFPSIDYFEGRGTPFVVAVNCFEGARKYRLDEVQAALNLDPGVPVLLCDARQRESSKEVLITLMEHAMKTREARRRAAAAE
ncbi:ATP/GTP-binding protein [Micromonospora sp. NPDC048170]|uniref:GTP-binding protein n=1 Tax=Micromonospora sp. NPDC048170 TaxID=3154819 RepID=UPI0033C0D193